MGGGGLRRLRQCHALALRSLIDNRIAQGQIDAATTSVSDPVAFTRIQAQTLKPEQALAEGYRRNLAGDYAEAEAYFQVLQDKLLLENETAIDPVEFLVNRALQKSNLGDFGEAERLFAEARRAGAGDPVNERLQRNFEAIHQINRGRPDRAIARLDRPLASDFEGLLSDGRKVDITIPIAARLNANRGAGVNGINTDVALTPRERAQLIDAQALQLRGTALRLMGRLPEAGRRWSPRNRKHWRCVTDRVTTATRLRAQILSELGLVEERMGNAAEGERRLREGLGLVQAQYPERRAVAAVQGRLASFLLRNGKSSEGTALYASLVERGIASGGSATGFSNELVPYFRYLTDRMASDRAAAADFFTAAQLLVRPGVAETQAVLARQLSGGSDEAARLFRQTTDLSREIEQLRVRYLALQRAEDKSAVAEEAAGVAARIRDLEQTQATAQANLASFPQYRAVSARAITLPEFQKQLTPGEAYARVAIIGQDVMMFYADQSSAKAWRTGLSVVDLDTAVDLLRHTISVQEDGRYVTYPFDIAGSRKLFTALFGPVEGQLAGVKHLVFEPDGALLRLPVDLLVTDDASVARYQKRTAKADADPYDFRGTAWLKRGRMISTATSAQSFIDARNARASQAREQYLGLGSNVPVGSDPAPAIRAVLASGSKECGWKAAEWNRPIAKTELVEASQVVGQSSSELMTGADFTDVAIKQKSDLGNFRILHFATHGLVTPPRPDCPVRPALLTSFGAQDSDGLLTFDEVFDLGLDADLVILSACDTAGSASVEATRAAGLSSGGGTALDGLVRSFIGAGGRAVLASHWPAPDDFNATERLMNEMFRRGRHRDAGRGAYAIGGIAHGRCPDLPPLLLGGFRAHRRCDQAAAFDSYGENDPDRSGRAQRRGRLMVATARKRLLGMAMAASSAAVLSGGPVHAQGTFQAAPTREEVLRSEIDRQLREGSEAIDARAAFERAPCPLADPKFDGIRLTLNSVTFTGAENVEPGLLDAAWSDYRDKDLPVAAICEIRDRAAALLRDNGYVASVQVPVQTIEGGAARFDVVVARLVSFVVRGETGGSGKVVESYLSPLRDNPVFDTRQAERALLLTRRIPGIDVRMTLARAAGADARPGDLVGVVDVVNRPIEADIAVQNLGSDQVGPWGGQARLRLNGLTGLGDQTELSVFATPDFDEQLVVQGRHEFAVGRDGLRIGANAVHAWTRPDVPGTTSSSPRPSWSTAMLATRFFSGRRARSTCVAGST